MRAVYITMTHKTKTLCFSTQLNATSKFKTSDISRLLKRQENCMCLLVAHQLKIKDFPVTVKDIDVVHNIWGKSVPSLKVNTTRKKSIPVSGYLVQAPEDLVKLHKEIYLMVGLLFFHSIHFFLTLSRKI